MNYAGYQNTGVYQNTSPNPALLHELFIRQKTSGGSKYPNSILSHYVNEDKSNMTRLALSLCVA